ncbi:hypothetical protein [Streptomyces sp. NPDC058953]|uniref:hypothetical protein n=1 Tax=Streptomyces sp. NPDC058953 TaxID=3346676 RepID=UPI0036B0A64E
MRHNLAARVGIWSAHHRKTAIVGWLLFVVLATVGGSSVGMIEMTESEGGAGDSARAQKILEDADLESPAGELVLVSSRTEGGWKATAAELTRTVAATGETTRIEPPQAGGRRSEERERELR